MDSKNLPFTLRQLQYLNEVSLSGSIAMAAQRLQVTPVALALGIHELEANLGLTLLIKRKGQGSSITSDGRMILKSARHLLNDARNLASIAQEVRTATSGALRIGCFPTLSPFFVPTLVKDFATEFPQIKFDVTEHSHKEMQDLLLDGQLDLTIQYEFHHEPELFFTPIYNFYPYVLVAKDHHLASHENVTLLEIANENFIGLDVDPTLKNTQEILSGGGITPHFVYHTSNFETARCLVGNGLGITLLFQSPVTATAYDGTEVRTIRLIDNSAFTPVGICQPKDSRSSQRISSVLDFLDDFVNKSPLFKQ